jgi:exodeoxyribonuclease V alpha subunit
MAWHDNGWDGRVCQDPRSNTYCSGAHSLLSGRIEKNKDVDFEQGKKGLVIAGQFAPAAVPPCYWSINAFGAKGFKIEHHHAFSNPQRPIPAIPDKVKPFSVFTWPFKLSFTHDKAYKKKHGNYPPNLDRRIEIFIQSFTPRQSVLFFYANYDNPVSADEMKYLLIGCSLISELPEPTHYPFNEQELQKWRSSGKKIDGGALKMKNFPTMNWALQFTHDPKSAVMLPYKEYIKYAEEHPEDDGKLDEMKVVIEEESLVRGFKYVSMDIDDDKCLYLLYKLRKSIKKIREHDRAVVNSDMADEEERLERLIKATWENRGVYPALGKVLNHFMEDDDRSAELAEAVCTLTTPKCDLLDILKRIIDEDIPKQLKDFDDELLDLAENRLFKKNIAGLASLSLFNLTQHQVGRVIDQPGQLKEIEINPYALYEEYIAEEDDLDTSQMQDEPIDVYKLDVGMIPDRRFVKRHRNLQSLSEDSPQRIRSVYINYLKRIGQQGHCYDTTSHMIEEIKEYPLIYKMEGANIDEQALISLEGDYKSHFIEKLQITHDEGVDFYYLKRIYEAEKLVKKVVSQMVARPDHVGAGFKADAYIAQALQSDTLKKIITSKENRELFSQERRQLYANIFSKSFFLLTGKPGAGKTFETSRVIEHLYGLHEDVVILAPTGKAALRVTANIRENTKLKDIAARTIDKFLYEKFAAVMNGQRQLENVRESEKITVENLIIDESSMIDLEKLHTLFAVIKFSARYPKRIIMVGDENQLPPIGFGKPFHDMIRHILADPKLTARHYINLKSNCRQENDPTILALADAFTDKRRYYEDALELANKTGWVSSGLFICQWSDTKSLNNALEKAMTNLFEKENLPDGIGNAVALNRLFGLYDNGNVNNQDYAFRDHLRLETLQLLTPYRGGYYGTLGLNTLIQRNYRDKPHDSSETSAFYHADKIIRLANWYRGWGADRELVLSNGSIGICKGEGQDRQYYFKELEYPRRSVGEEEDYDLAYAISVHRSQGSDFRNVFLVIPKKRALLTKELIYTALTRSKFRLFLFIQENDENLLLKARNTSHLLGRNTSIFQSPVDHKAKLVPDPQSGPVKSRIEYIIYQALQRSGLKFRYEQTLSLQKRGYDIHPDFTIELQNGTQIFWEHLGMLDVRKYYSDWQQRITDYKDHGLFDRVVTTDDLDGIKHEKIDAVIEAIRTGNLATDKGNRFSLHHYELY